MRPLRRFRSTSDQRQDSAPVTRLHSESEFGRAGRKGDTQHSFLCCCQTCLFCLPSSGKWYARKCKDAMGHGGDIDSLAAASKSTSALLPPTPSTVTAKSTPNKSPSIKEDLRDDGSLETRSPLPTPTEGKPPSPLRSRGARGSTDASLSPLTPSSHHQAHQSSPTFPTPRLGSMVSPSGRATPAPSALFPHSKPGRIITPVSNSQASFASSMRTKNASSSSDIVGSADRSFRSLFDYIMEGSSDEEDRPAPVGSLLEASTPKRPRGEQHRERVENPSLRDQHTTLQQYPLQLPSLLPSNFDSPLPDVSPSSSFRSALEDLMEASAAERGSESAVCSEDVAYWYRRPSPMASSGGTTFAPLSTIAVADDDRPQGDVDIQMDRISPLSSDAPVDSSSSFESNPSDSNHQFQTHVAISLATGKVSNEEFDAQSSSSDDAIAGESVISSFEAGIVPVVEVRVSRGRQEVDSLSESEQQAELVPVRPPRFYNLNVKLKFGAVLVGILLAAIVIALMALPPVQNSFCKWQGPGIVPSRIPIASNHPLSDMVHSDNHRTITPHQVGKNETTFREEDDIPRNDWYATAIGNTGSAECPCSGDKSPETSSIMTNPPPLLSKQTLADAMAVQTIYQWWWTPSLEWENSRTSSHPRRRQGPQPSILRFVLRWRRRFQCISRCLSAPN